MMIRIAYNVSRVINNFHGAKKEDLRLNALELNMTSKGKMITSHLNNSIKNSDKYKNIPTFVTDVSITVIENENKRV